MKISQYSILFSVIISIAISCSIHPPFFTSDKIGRVKIIRNGSYNYETEKYDLSAPGETVVTDKGELLRGTTFWCITFHPHTVDYANNFEAWKRIPEHHFNCVRLAVNHWEPHKYGDGYEFTLDEWLQKIDRWVDWGEQLGLYVILDHHEVGMHTQERLREFWTAAAPRYAGRTHILYEIANEPVGWHVEDYTQNDIDDFMEIYRIMRRHAPDTHIILLSYAVPDPGMENVAARLEGVDWTNASVGFHGYWKDSSVPITELKKHYPCINTEFGTYNPDHGPTSFKLDGLLWQPELMERLKISWICWNANFRPERVDEIMKPMIKAAEEGGYKWW